MKSKRASPAPFTIHLQLRCLFTAVQLPSLHMACTQPSHFWSYTQILKENKKNAKQRRQKQEAGFTPPPGEVKRHPEAAGAAARCFAPREAAAAYVYARLELPCSFIARHGILHPGPALPSANRSHSSRG